MKLEKLKELFFAFGTYSFLILFFLSFSDIEWDIETLKDFKPYLGVLGLILVFGYIEKSQTVFSTKIYYLIRVFAVIFSIIVHLFLTL